MGVSLTSGAYLRYHPFVYTAEGAQTSERLWDETKEELATAVNVEEALELVKRER